MKPRIVLVLIAVSVVACGQEDPVVARVGDAEIPLSQVERFVERLPQGLRSQGTGRVAIEDHVWSLIDHHLTLAEARRRGLATDAEIQRELAHQERRWLAQLYRERSGIADITVSADDVERTFLRLGFDKERLLTRLIVADEDLLAEALGRVRSGAELAEVAHSYGEMDSLALGDGTVGWIGREALARYRIPEEVFFSIQDRRLAPVADLGGAWQIYQFENTRSRPLADVWELVHERTLREHRSRQSHQEYEQLAHQLALRVRPEGMEAALALGGAGVAPQSLEEPLGAQVLCDFDGDSLTVRDFLTALLRIGFRSALRDSGHVMQLASSEVLPIYLFAAAARSQAWDKEPEFQEFAEQKQQQLMLKALEEQAAAESGPIAEKDIRAYYDRNQGAVPGAGVRRHPASLCGYLGAGTGSARGDRCGSRTRRPPQTPVGRPPRPPPVAGSPAIFPHSRGALSGIGRGGVRCRDGRCRRPGARWGRLCGL